MRLYAELSLQAVDLKTRVDIGLDHVHNGVHDELWRRSTIIDISAYQTPELSETWLRVVLRALLDQLSPDVVVVQAEELEQQAAGEHPYTARDVGSLREQLAPADPPTGPSPKLSGELLQ